MIIKNDIKYLFIGQILPEKNNVYEENLLCEMYKQIDDSLTVLSINKAIRDKNITNELGQITIDILPTKRKLIIDDFYRIFKTISYVKKWCINNKNYQKKVQISCNKPHYLLYYNRAAEAGCAACRAMRYHACSR